MQGIFTEERAREAVSLVRPAIRSLLEGRAKRQHLHIVVVDGTKKAEGASFEESILHEYSIGNRADWEHSYDKIALEKARQAWRTGMPNLLVLSTMPAALRDRDTIHYGTFVYGGVVVGVSGIQPYFDMLIAGWVALACSQIIIDDVEIWKRHHPNADFLDFDALYRPS